VNRKIIKKIKRVFLYLVVVVILISVLMPFFWMVSGSFKTRLEIQASDTKIPGKEPSWIPRRPTLRNYVTVNKEVKILDYFKNSIVISLGTMFFCILIAVMAGYSISRFAFPGRSVYTVSVLSTQMFPGILFLIPYFVMFIWIRKNIGLPMRNTYWGMIFTYTSFALPFSIWILRGYFNTIPREIDEQAQIDGCTRVGALFRVIVPLAKPGITAVGIYAFIMAWNEILFASVLTGKDTTTVAIGLLKYITAQEARWGGMMAACVLVSLPVLAFFTVLQKQFVRGLVAGAMKG
jgi:multiple sugar transport system permease protein